VYLFYQPGQHMLGLPAPLPTIVCCVPPQVEQKFPNKTSVKLMVGDSDGRSYAIDVLEALEEAGYTNLVGIKGGYNAWFR
jgi:hypothetical protein